MKNNFCGSGAPAPFTFRDLTDLQEKMTGTVNGRRGALNDRSFLAALGEGRVVSLQAYLLGARQEGAESVNCGIAVPNVPEFHDIHIALTQDAPTRQTVQPGNVSEEAECKSVTAEMSPHHRPLAWNVGLLSRVAAMGLAVRVTGQLFYDSAHPPCSNGHAVSGHPRRVSGWEIHPIYRFEICPISDCANGGWMSLEDFGRK